MNELIESLVASLKEEEVYQNYIKCKKALDEHADLLWRFKEVKEEYIKMKPLFQYQDFTNLKQNFEDLSKQVTHLEAYQNYMNASHLLQQRLDELTSLIFQNVLVEAEEAECVSLQENTKEEI